MALRFFLINFYWTNSPIIAKFGLPIEICYLMVST